jgi:hypothetical protein
MAEFFKAELENYLREWLNRGAADTTVAEIGVSFFQYIRTAS